jgi:hypothetical protein
MPAENLVFGCQCGFSFLVMTFCVGMLASNKAPELYLPVVTSLIGYWLPSPKYRSGSIGSVTNLPNLFMRRRSMDSGRAPAPRSHGANNNRGDCATNDNNQGHPLPNGSNRGDSTPGGSNQGDSIPNSSNQGDSSSSDSPSSHDLREVVVVSDPGGPGQTIVGETGRHQRSISTWFGV